MISTNHHNLAWRSNQEELNWREMWHAWDRREAYRVLVRKTKLKESDRVEEVGVHRMITLTL